MKLKRTLILQKENCYDDVGSWTNIKTSKIMDIAYQISPKYNIDILTFKETGCVTEKVHIITKGKKKDYLAFSQDLVRKLTGWLAGYWI